MKKSILVILAVSIAMLVLAFTSSEQKLSYTHDDDAAGVGSELQTIVAGATDREYDVYKIYIQCSAGTNTVYIVSAPNTWNATAANYVTKRPVPVADTTLIEVDMSVPMTAGKKHVHYSPTKFADGITIDFNGNTGWASVYYQRVK